MKNSWMRWCFSGQTIDLKPRPWREHPDNKGVYLKDCLTLDQTGQRFSCRLVRLDAGAVIARHQHPHSLELHKVMAGLNKENQLLYKPGLLAVMGRGSFHEVRAGVEGLGLWAKFIQVSL